MQVYSVSLYICIARLCLTMRSTMTDICTIITSMTLGYDISGIVREMNMDAILELIITLHCTFQIFFNRHITSTGSYLNLVCNLILHLVRRLVLRLICPLLQSIRIIIPTHKTFSLNTMPVQSVSCRSITAPSGSRPRDYQPPSLLSRGSSHQEIRVIRLQPLIRSDILQLKQLHHRMP